MALGLAQAAAQNMFNAELKGSAFTAPSAWYIKFHVGDPGSAGTANAATNTTRYAVTFGSMSAPVFGLCLSTNTSLITLTSVPATETYTNFSLWTDPTAGSFILSGTVSGGAVTAATSPTIAANALVIGINAAV